MTDPATARKRGVSWSNRFYIFSISWLVWCVVFGVLLLIAGEDGWVLVLTWAWSVPGSAASSLVLGYTRVR